MACRYISFDTEFVAIDGKNAKPNTAMSSCVAVTVLLVIYLALLASVNDSQLINDEVKSSRDGTWIITPKEGNKVLRNMSDKTAKQEARYYVRNVLNKIFESHGPGRLSERKKNSEIHNVKILTRSEFPYGKLKYVLRGKHSEERTTHFPIDALKKPIRHSQEIKTDVQLNKPDDLDKPGFNDFKDTLSSQISDIEGDPWTFSNGGEVEAVGHSRFGIPATVVKVEGVDQRGFGARRGSVGNQARDVRGEFGIRGKVEDVGQSRFGGRKRTTKIENVDQERFVGRNPGTSIQGVVDSRSGGGKRVTQAENVNPGRFSGRKRDTESYQLIFGTDGGEVEDENQSRFGGRKRVAEMKEVDQSRFDGQKIVAEIENVARKCLSSPRSRFRSRKGEPRWNSDAKNDAEGYQSILGDASLLENEDEFRFGGKRQPSRVSGERRKTFVKC